MQAWRLRKQRWKQRDIAVALDVSEGAVSRWLSAAHRGGKAALWPRRHAGASPKLTPAQMRLIPDFLGHGSEAYGFRGKLWTTVRVAKVIEEEFGISYSKGHVSRLLKQLQWTPQIPVIRALQRDEKEIRHWQREVWPELRCRAARERRTLVFTDESGFYLLPGVVKMYAPKAKSPVIKEWQTHDHLSVMGAVTREAKLYSMVREESFTGLQSKVSQALDPPPRASLAGNLGRVAHPPPGERQGVPCQPRRTRGAYRASASYAPDLNPVEEVWSN